MVTGKVTEHIIKEISIGWLNLDAWSETYVGAHWLVTCELNIKQYESLPRHGPLSQMVLLSAHHLVEVMFFQCVRSLIKKNLPGTYPEIEKGYDRANFLRAFGKWPEIMVGRSFDVSREPFKSVVLLSSRRNATIHKESALTSLAMAKSALFTAAQASKLIAEHLLGNDSFKYETVLQKYPLPPEPWFSEVHIVDAVT